MKTIKQGSIGVIGLLVVAMFQGRAQTNTLKFTATQATDERAIQLRWRSETNAIYRLEYAKELSGSIVWDTLVDCFPAQGTNTIFLDTGKYWTEPALPHPKDDAQRFYRIVKIGMNTLAPPIVTITNLTAGTNLSGEVEIDVHIATTNSITFVRYFVDGEEVELGGADGNGDSSYTINTTEWPNGPHVVFVVAETAAGSETTGSPSTAESGTGMSAAIPVSFDNYISKWYFTLPGFDASLGETQRITAEFISYSSWTLQVVDEYETTVRNASGTGNSMVFDWDGNDDSGFPTADGTYDFILTANQTTPPQNFSTLATGNVTSSMTALSSDEESPTVLLAAPADNSGGAVPLALYPPGLAEAQGLVIFEGSLADFRPQRTLSSSVMPLAASSSSSGSFASSYSGTSQTTQRPHRPPPKPIKGTPGKFGVAWQGDHPDTGGFSPPANLTGFIQLSPNYSRPYGPIHNATNIAAGFENTMKKYKWKRAFNYGNDQLSASLLRKPSKGGSNLFN